MNVQQLGKRRALRLAATTYILGVFGIGASAGCAGAPSAGSTTSSSVSATNCAREERASTNSSSSAPEEVGTGASSRGALAPETQPESALAAEKRPPPAQPNPDAKCQLSEPEEVESAKLRVRGVAIARHPAGMLLAYAESYDSVTVQLRDPHSDAVRFETEVQLPGAQFVRGLYPTERHILLMTAGFCPKRQDQCVQFVALDEQGRAVGPVLEDRIREWLKPLDIAVDANGVQFAMASTYLRPMVVRYRVDESGVMSRQTVLEVPSVSKSGYEVQFGGAQLGFAWLLESTGTGPSHIWSERHPEALTIKGLGRVEKIGAHVADADGVRLVYQTPGKRGRAAQISWEGKLSQEKDATIPAALAKQVNVSTYNHYNGSWLMLARRDALGSDLMDPIRLVRYGSNAAGAVECNHSRSECHVLWSDGDTHSKVYLAKLACQ